MKIEVNGSIEFLPEEPEARRARVGQLIEPLVGPDLCAMLLPGLTKADLAAENEELRGQVDDLEEQVRNLEDEVENLSGNLETCRDIIRETRRLPK